MMRSNSMQTDPLVTKGQWTWGDEGVEWKLYAATTIPNVSDCTAAFCVAIRHDKIVLAREDRGWSLIGGHIEDGETVGQALRRECLEEGGFTVEQPVLFAYRKIIASKPVAHPTPGKAYPFPISYIAYYFAANAQPLAEPTEPEILEVREFTLAELEAMPFHDLPTVMLGLEGYRRQSSAAQTNAA